MGRRSTRRAVEWVGADRESASRIDSVAVEEPLELRIAGASLAVTMRTPGNDVELAHGLLLSEGIISGRDDVRAAHRCSGRSSSEERADNVLDLTLAPGIGVAEQLTRRMVTPSACAADANSCEAPSPTATRSGSTSWASASSARSSVDPSV